MVRLIRRAAYIYYYYDNHTHHSQLLTPLCPDLLRCVSIAASRCVACYLRTMQLDLLRSGLLRPGLLIIRERQTIHCLLMARILTSNQYPLTL